MKRLNFLFLFAFLTANLISQNNYQKLVKIDNVYKIQYNNTYFDVDTKVVTVKPKSPNFTNFINVSVIRSNKLGFVDLQVPNGLSVEEFVKELNMSELFDVVEYNTFGEYCFSLAAPRLQRGG
ncbi:MAG: hypothetical protein FWD66_03755 [Paludibacter sp.]|nr:hypothetical protein [Paludibacter sp.]